MIILSQKVKTKWTTKNKKHYIKKGYKFTKYKDELEIDVLDLPQNSNINVLCKCDYCGKEVYRRFSSVNPNKKITCSTDLKVACKKCTNLKREDRCLEKYGVKHQAQTKEMQQKIKQTCLEKYGVEYTGQIPQKKEKTKQTCLKKYGVEHTLQAKEIRDQIKQTNLHKYGYKSPIQNTQIEEKIKQTCLEKYGVEYVFQAEEVKEKIKETNIKRYGVESYLQTDEYKEKTKQTCLKKYGVEHVLQAKEIRNKIKQTNLEKYGVEHLMKIEEIKNYRINKARQTMYENGTAPSTKPQRYIYELLGGENTCKYNYPISRCSLDIAYPDEMLYIEYDGGGHNLSVIHGSMTQKEFDIKEIHRKRFLQNLGWKIIRIISQKDKLLSDNEMIKLIKEAKEYLLNSNHTWVEIDMDKMEYRCSQHVNKIIPIGTQILEGKGIKTYMDQHIPLLMDIRNGKYSYEEIFEMSNQLEEKFKYAKENTNLPDKPNFKTIDEIVMSINKDVVNNKEV